MDEEEDSGIGQSLVSASSSSKSSNEIVNSAEDAKRIQAANAMEARARKEAEEEAAGIVARSYGYAFSNRDYYTGSYFITEAQKRLALNIGFKQVGKVYAMPRTGVTINIREGGSLDDRIVGKLDKDGVCYVLEDDGKDWIFVESGVTSWISASRLRRARKRSARKISSLPIRRWILLKIRHSATL